MGFILRAARNAARRSAFPTTLCLPGGTTWDGLLWFFFFPATATQGSVRRFVAFSRTCGGRPIPSLFIRVLIRYVFLLYFFLILVILSCPHLLMYSFEHTRLQSRNCEILLRSDSTLTRLCAGEPYFEGGCVFAGCSFRVHHTTRCETKACRFDISDKCV